MVCNPYRIYNSSILYQNSFYLSGFIMQIKHADACFYLHDKVTVSTVRGSLFHGHIRTPAELHAPEHFGFGSIPHQAHRKQPFSFSRDV